MGEIVLQGLAANDPVPGDYVEVDFAAGVASGASATYSALLIGGKLSTGAATADTVIYGPDTPVPLVSEDDAIALFGEGSELHRMWFRFTAVNTTTPLYAIAVSEGSSPSAATGTITFTTTATGFATCRLYIADKTVDFGIATGDTVTTIAANAASAINTLLRSPVTATSASGVVTITTKQKGLRGNFVRYFARIFPTAGVGTTVSPTASTLTSGGTVSDSNTTALATISAARFYYIVPAAGIDDGSTFAQLSALVSQVNTQALPVTGIRQRVFAASQDTVANTITISTGVNAARCEVTHLPQSDVPPCELAANAAAIYSLGESPAKPKLNWDFYGQDSTTQATWKIPAPLSGAKLTRSQIFSLLNSGITPIAVTKGGNTYLVSRATTRFLNGSNPDYRIRDAHKVTICDRYADDLIAIESEEFAGATIADDPSGNETPPDGAVTPRVLLSVVNRLTRSYDANGLLQSTDVIIANTVAQRSLATPTRLTSRTPLRPIDVLHQTGNLIQQVA